MLGIGNQQALSDDLECDLFLNTAMQRLPISSWFRIRIHGFRFGFAVSYSEVEYETGKFKSDSLVFQRKLITLKVKIPIVRVSSQI